MQRHKCGIPAEYTPRRADFARTRTPTIQDATQNFTSSTTLWIQPQSIPIGGISYTFWRYAGILEWCWDKSSPATWMPSMWPIPTPTRSTWTGRRTLLIQPSATFMGFPHTLWSKHASSLQEGLCGFLKNELEIDAGRNHRAHETSLGISKKPLEYPSVLSV